MDSEFFIRRAETADIPGMCGLLSELFSIEKDFSPDMKKQTSGLKLLLDNKSGSSIVLVAENGDEIIGMCSLQTLVSTAEGGAVGLLEDLIVRNKCRGKGVGTMLASAIISWCMGKNISRIQLLRDADNEKALAFYKSLGWNETTLVCMRRFV